MVDRGRGNSVVPLQDSEESLFVTLTPIFVQQAHLNDSISSYWNSEIGKKGSQWG